MHDDDMTAPPLTPEEVAYAEREAATVRAAAGYRRGCTFRTIATTTAVVLYGLGVWYFAIYRDDYQAAYSAVTWAVLIYAIGDAAVTVSRKRFQRSIARLHAR